MASFYYGFDDTKNDGTKLHAAEWVHLVRMFSSQLQGALRLHGPGIVAWPDESSFEVEVGGPGEPLTIKPGAAIIPHGVGFVWAFDADGAEIPLSAFLDEEGVQDKQFVHLAVQVASVTGAPDTRENNTPLIAVSDQEVLDGHLLLLEVTLVDGELTLVLDRRKFSPALGRNALLTLLLGSGRITAFDTSLLAPAFEAGTLNITLPANSEWVIGGVYIKLDSALSIEAPSNAAGKWGLLSLDESGLPAVLEDDWLDAPPARGAGVLGKVVSNAVEITALTDTARDIIQTEAAKQQRFEAIEARLTLMEGGDEGGGGFAYSGMASWLPEPDDSRQTKTVISEMIAALRTELITMISNGGVRPHQTDLSHVIGESAIMRQEIAKIQLFLRAISTLQELDLNVELGLERSQSANIVGIPGGTEIYGVGNNSFPDHLGASTLTMNADGTVEP
ncbi:MAG TPA: hypothetical protein VGB77_22305 [Abditibacteriaceae bacterium]|jgi:hypothetical protein